MVLKNSTKSLAGSRIGIGRSHGTFGEILQGVLPCNKDFLVTLPIQQFSESKFISKPDKSELKVYPPKSHKSYLLATKILSFFNLPIGGTLTITSDIKQGKGLASSSADMVATAKAIENCFGLRIPVGLLENFMREIEPSDGIMHPGVVAYYQKEVKIRNYLGECPPLTILGLDEMGEIDTISFNQQEKPFNYKDKLKYQELLNQAIVAFKTNDYKLLGNVATESTLLNQKLLKKKTLPDMLSICRQINGLGIVTAHSGTYIGILISNNDPNYNLKIESGMDMLKQLGYPVHLFHSI